MQNTFRRCMDCILHSASPRRYTCLYINLSSACFRSVSFSTSACATCLHSLTRSLVNITYIYNNNISYIYNNNNVSYIYNNKK